MCLEFGDTLSPPDFILQRGNELVSGVFIHRRRIMGVAWPFGTTALRSIPF